MPKSPAVANRKSRRNIYTAIIIGAVVVWVVVEAVIPGISETLSNSAEEVAARLGTTIPTIGAVVAAALALVNLSDDPEPEKFTAPGNDKIKPQGYEQGLVE